MTNKNNIEYPYLPDGQNYYYVPSDNEFMIKAREVAEKYSLDDTMPNGTVIVKDNLVIGTAANGSEYHKVHGCERVRLGIPTGQHYELCEGCSPKNHGEPRAIAEAIENGRDVSGADLYIWGHWWACRSCWDEMLNAGINRVYLMEDSQILFNKSNPNNIVGKQFGHN